MLQIEGLEAGYDGTMVLRDLSLKVDRGQIVSIIGSNGAGKSTLLNTLSGLVKKQRGSVFFLGQEVPRAPHKIVKMGIVQVPEGRKVFSGLTVRENLVMGGYAFEKRRIKGKIENILELFPILKERFNQHAGTLSGGEQQMLALGRGLLSEPKLLMLDEPSLGLAPQIVTTVYNVIRDIRNRGITVLLVEQNAKKALELCDYAYLLENGAIVKKGLGRELLNDEAVKNAYLGAGEGAH